MSGTRVVYPADQREVSVRLTNEGESPVLVQAWLDQGDPTVKPEHISVPFTLTPPVFRMDPQRGQTMRLMYTKEPLPQDRESVYWLNVLEIPPKPANQEVNQLQLAFRTRIKVFFRPKELAGSAAKAPSNVTWALTPIANGQTYSLTATNPTPYAVSFSKVLLKSEDQTYIAESGMVKPFESVEFVLKNIKHPLQGRLQVLYQSITDYGGSVDGTATLK